MSTSATGKVVPPAVASDGTLWSAAERRTAWIGVGVAVSVFLLLATGAQPWRLFEHGPYTSDFYDVQARSLVHGRLDVPRDVAGPEGFDIDGKVQLYFGLGPSLLRVPFTGWSGALDGRLTLASELVAVVVLGYSAARLFARARRSVVTGEVGRPWWFAVAGAAPVLATPVLFLSARPVVWHEAELWGAAAGVAGLVLVVRWFDHPSTAHLLQAMAMATFAMACRPSSGAAPAVALALFAVRSLVGREWRRAVAVAACAVVALMGFVAVNELRFGAPTSLPFEDQGWTQVDARRQVAMEENDGQLVGAKFVPTAVRQYLSPIAVRPERLFPFVAWGPDAEPVGGLAYDNIQHTSSLPTGAPAMCVLAAVGGWWTLRRDRSWVWRTLVVAAALPTFVTVSIAIIAQRYLVDFVPLLVVLAAPAVWSWARSSAGWPRWSRRASVAALAVLAFAGAWAQAGLMWQERAFTLLPSRQRQLDAVRFQYDLDDRLRGGVPPSVEVVQGDELPPMRNGQLAILGECSGLYRSDGASWTALEWSAGEGRRLVLSGPLDEGRTEVVSGDGWAVTIEPADGRSVVVYRSEDGREERSAPFDADRSASVVDVAADPLTSQVAVAVDGRSQLELVFAASSGLAPALGWTSVPAGAPVCERLLARMSS